MGTLAVALVSAAVLAYEVLLTRLFAVVQWHHFAFMIISVALLGFGASGTFAALAGPRLQRRPAAAFVGFALLFAAGAPAGFALAQALPFNALEIVWDPRQAGYLLAIYAALVAPFFCGATCVVLALSRPGAPVARVYAADLAGAGAGALGIVAALSWLHPVACLGLVASLGVLAAGCAAAASPRRGWRAAALALVAIGAALPVLPTGGPWLTLRVSPYKGLSAALEVPGARVVAERSGPLGLLHVVESPAVPFRHAPGLSLGAPAEPPEQLGLFTDADAMSPIARFDGDAAPLDYLD